MFSNIGTTTTAASGFPTWAIVVIVVAAVAGVLLVASVMLVIVCVCCLRGDDSTSGNKEPTLVPVVSQDDPESIRDRPLPGRHGEETQGKDAYPHASGMRSTIQSSTVNMSGVQGVISPTVGVSAGQLPFTDPQMPGSGSGQYPYQTPYDAISIESGEYQNPGEYVNPSEFDPTRAAGVSAAGAGGQSEGEEERRAPPSRPVDPEAVGPDGNKIGNSSKVQ